MRIQREATSAIIVDIQERLSPHIAEIDSVIKRTNILISGLAALSVPVIVTEQYTKGLGSTVESVRTALGDSYRPIEKMTFSCCGAVDVMVHLTSEGKQFIILAGIETHVCVLQTALDLIEQGFTPVIPADAVSSRSVADKEIALRRLASAGAIVTSVESLLFELCVVAGTDTFKAISALVK